MKRPQAETRAARFHCKRPAKGLRKASKGTEGIRITPSVPFFSLVRAGLLLDPRQLILPAPVVPLAQQLPREHAAQVVGQRLATLRREGAPIPLRPLKRWDDGRNVVLAGDAAGVVAPASGEGIYYAMLGGRLAADAAAAFLASGDARDLKAARKRFMRQHGRVFWILGLLQRFWYVDDRRREKFVAMCRDPDVQYLTWQAYTRKELVRARPAAHVRIFFKDLAQLLGLARA